MLTLFQNIENHIDYVNKSENILNKDALIMDIYEKYLDYEEAEYDEVFGGWFPSQATKKQRKNKRAYQNQIFKYKDACYKRDEIFIKMYNIFPENCVKLISEFNGPIPQIEIKQYITRCCNTYEIIEKCVCYHCVYDRLKKEEEYYEYMEYKNDYDY